MSLTASSTLAHRARCVQAASIALPGSVGSAVVAPYHHQQTRGFRFAKLWANYLDAEFHRDVCRHKDLRQKYAETLNQKLSWDKSPPTRRPWRTDYPKSRIGGRWASTDATNTTLDNPEGVRPGQNIEDVERAPLEQLLFGTKEQRRPKNKSKKHASPLSSSSNYTIDPITNRKVPTSPVTEDSLPNILESEPSFKSYRSQFSIFQPPSVDHTQAPIFYDGPPPESELKLYSEVKLDEHPWDTPSPAALHPRTTPATKADEASPTLLDAIVRENKDVTWQGTDVIGSTLSQTAPAYDDLHKYRAVADPEPHIIGEDPAAGGVSAGQESEKHENLDKYGAVRWQERDGKSTIEPEQAEAPQELGKYGAVRSHEPDGKYAVESGQEIQPEELEKYDAVRAHEPDGKYKVDVDPEVNQQELAKYEAVRAHEPDGKYAVEYTDPNPDPAELAEYSKPFLSHEPDGKYAETHVEPSLNEVELASYRKAFRSHEPDGKYAANQQSMSYDASELKTYGAFLSHEPDGKYASNAEPTTGDAELAPYKPFKAHEPDGLYAEKAAELDEYDTPFGRDGSDGRLAYQQASATELSDLGNHEAFTVDDSETKAGGQATKVVEEMPEFEEYDPARHGKITAQMEAATETQMPDPKELDKYTAVRWNEPDGQPVNAQSSEGQFILEEKTSFQNTVERLTVVETDWLAKDFADSGSKSSDGKGAASGLKKRRLTGQYVQDFPEDFAVQWSAEPSASKSSLLPTDLNSSSSPSAAAVHTEGSKSQSKAAANEVPAGPVKSTIYKILVYDPVMQAIDVAETSSIVPDTATPLTPADVLLRISNPSRFFPHFAPLQAQGFEIVSGSGDVLIFRKVRDASDDKVAPTETIPVSTAAPVNPIDMTGNGRLGEYHVAAGRFASPTGFVNYEWPPDRSSTYTHRGAPVTSEPKAEELFVNHAKPGETKKRSLPRRLLIGAATLAGISYSVGFVGDQLKTGVKEVKPASTSKKL
ncbi:hypothetical protein QBC35DRAFT_211242 [Podospora australis]|uniref:Uncharacterized protein n=1 Tax=Podospora australis TaxID=1536484 RepID=A0AAN7AI51_9PEZI|nr:hypothetical protein QBC35DRAFT_211242 [Podospora australis]